MIQQINVPSFSQYHSSLIIKQLGINEGEIFMMKLFFLRIFFIYFLFQWAKIVLILEQSLSPAVRVSIQHKYSTPVWDGRQDRAMIIQTENEVNLAFTIVMRI